MGVEPGAAGWKAQTNPHWTMAAPLTVKFVYDSASWSVEMLQYILPFNKILAVVLLESGKPLIGEILNQEKGTEFGRHNNGWQFWIRIFLNGAIPGLFFIYFLVFKQTLQFLQQIGVWKKSIQYTVPGFEPTTFVKWVSFHNLYYFQNILPKSTYSKAISFCVSRRVVNRRMNECCRTVFEIWFLLGSEWLWWLSW